MCDAPFCREAARTDLARTFTTATAQGVISPGEAAGLAQMVDTFVRAIDAADFERRLRLLEEDRGART